MTVFSDRLFKKTEIVHTLKNGDVYVFVMTLRHQNGNFLEQLIRQDTKGSIVGRLVSWQKNAVSQESPIMPSWVIPGTVFRCEISDYKVALTLKTVFQTRIEGILPLLGGKYQFDYLVVSEFED